MDLRSGGFCGLLRRLLSVVGTFRGFRIFDARPEETYQRLADCLPRFVDVIHGQAALVELAGLQLSTYGVGDHVLDTLRGRLRQGLYGSFYGIGEHHDAGLSGLRQAAGVAEVRLADRALVGGVVQGLAVEVLDAGRAVGLGYYVQDLLRQPPRFPYFQAFLDVTFYHLGGKRRGEVGVGVELGDLVLHEVGRVLHLADVVVVGPDLSEQRVRADPLGGPLCEQAHLHGVGERTRGVAQQLVEQGVSRVRELQQLHRCQDIEGVFQERQQDRCQRQREEAVAEAEDTQPQGLLHATAGERHHAHHGGDHKSRLQEALAGVHAHGRVDREPRAQEQRRRQEEVVSTQDADVHAGDHDHQEHQPRSQQHGPDDGEPGQGCQVWIELQRDEQAGQRGKQDRERGGENEPDGGIGLKNTFSEAFQEVPGDPHLCRDHDPDTYQRHPRIGGMQEVQGLQPRPVARVYYSLGYDAFYKRPRADPDERRQEEPG